MKGLIYFLTFLFTFALVVGVHEAGHALTAKIFSVKIQKISLGFGRPLFKWSSRSGTEWVWALWPLGGYVQLLNSRIQTVPANQLHYCFDKKSLWIRSLILIAGGAANFILAWLALSIMFIYGYSVSPPIIKEVVPSSIADTAGLKAEDRFQNINGTAVDSWQETGMQLIIALGKKQVPVLIKNSQGETRTISLNLSQWTFKKQFSFLKSIGINPQLAKRYKENIIGLSLQQASSKAMKQLLNNLLAFLTLIKKIITGILPLSFLLGPIGLIDLSGQSFFQGFSSFLNFIANLSLSIGFINLFPIPGLDGASIIYILLEKIRGKPISIPIEILLYHLFLILFFVFFVQIVLNDIQRYVSLI